MAGKVESLLLRMSLDAEGYKRSMTQAKREVQLLKEQLKGLKGDTSGETAAKDLKSNLQRQLALVEGNVDQLKQKIEETKASMEKLDPSSQQWANANYRLNSFATEAARAITQANTLKDTLNNWSLDRFVTAMGQATSLFNSAQMALSGITDGAAALADAADQVSVSRESADAGVFKIANGMPGVDEQWMRDLTEWNQRLIQEVPITYEALAQIEANAMQAGGVAASGVREFALMFAKLQAATDLTGDSGAMALGQLAKLTGVAAQEYGNLGSAVVELGNNMAATESAIVQTAQGAASSLAGVGMRAADVLGLSAAAVGLGMEPQAASTALSKMAEDMARAAELGGEKAETYAAVLGVSAEQFARLFKSDAAQTFLDFFVSLGNLTADGSESILSYLDELGVKEVRQARLAKNFARVNTEVAQALTLSRRAYRENTALDAEAEQQFATTESQRILNANKMANAQEALGDRVKALRQPFDDFFADVKQGFADMPGWVQDSAALLLEGARTAGNVIGAVGDVAQSAYYTGKLVKDFKSAAPWLQTAGKVGLGVGAAAAGAGAIYMLGSALKDMAEDTTAISQGLANIRMHVDETSKQETLNAIATVKAAVLDLNDPADAAQYAQTSRLVQMGYGTSGMQGQALGYEQASSQRRIQEIYEGYNQQLDAAEEKLQSAQDRMAREAAQSEINALTAQMQASVQAEQAAYGQTLNGLVNGMLSQNEAAEGKLAEIKEKYSLLQLLYAANAINDPAARRKALTDADYYNRVTALGIKESKLLSIAPNGTGPGSGAQYLDYFDMGESVKNLYDSLAQDVAALFSDDSLTTLLSTVLSSGAAAGADAEQISGAFLSLLQAMDIKRIGDQGAANWEEIGKYSAGGLGKGMQDSTAPEDAARAQAEALLAAAKDALDIRSPSRKFQAIGELAAQGLAAGLLAGKNRAAAAVAEMGAAMEAEALAISARINAIFDWAYGGRGAGGGGNSGGGSGSGGGGALTQNFYVSGGVQTQAQIKRLAREMDALSRERNAGLGILRRP